MHDAVLPYYHDYGYHCSQDVGDGEGGPYAFDSEDSRHGEQQRHHEDYLAHQAHQDCLPGESEALEERGGYYLEADHEEGPGAVAQRNAGGVDQVLVLGEGHGDVLRPCHGYDGRQHGDYACGSDGEPEGVPQAPVVARAEVVAQDRLEALADAEDEGHGYRGECHEDAGGGNGEVGEFGGGIGYEGAVDDGVDAAGGGADQRGRGADADDSQEDYPAQAEGAAAEAQGCVAAAEVPEHEHGADAHGDVGCDGGAGDSHVEDHDEYRVEDYVGHGTDYHRHHGARRVARGAHHVVEAEGDVGQQQSRQQD